MKLNLTSEKLTRVLLSANPVLANCKGSVKAVRMFMNMLGMKCILSHNTNDTENADITISVSNVTDKDLQPIKAILTKQLQEILPINMIITEDHIKGYTDE